MMMQIERGSLCRLKESGWRMSDTNRCVTVACKSLGTPGQSASFCEQLSEKKMN